MKKLAILVTILLVQGLVYAQNAEVSYSVHMANVGWGGYSSNGDTAGTEGQGRQIEAIRVRITSDITGGIRYDVHAADIGWIGWKYDNDIGGTTGQGRRIEAIRVQLTGNLANSFDVRYQVHMADVGWGGWSMNGEDAGTTGQARQVEAIQIVLVPKDNADAFENIQFEPESAVLRASEKAKLDKAAEILSKYPDKKIQIGGHTALAGTPAGRIRVSRERAQAVANYLLSINALTSDQIVIQEFGAEQPVGDNKTTAGMRLNRRVEITILD
ncbi:MAG: OmpA family protein [Spirochaetaceae bacterium]|jgi:outer membrane protein OmpA-like peptidoglycan-associated protein|nr:OmpA family protein [Spirochaetaceae bacterium]